ncbi:NmrA family NAD(P)-binding protein [Streptomyces collinus]|uniref:NmrA family NAD(P)-binding protein n=1 Tax=Streptomyces collinus TaxID=42684 RepID=UPI0033B3D070
MALHVFDRCSLEAALAGADALLEARQGKALADAAVQARLGHLVFTSAAHADRGTGIPHYESKHLVEQHLRAAGVPWT